MKSYHEIMKDVKNPPVKKVDISLPISKQLKLPLAIVKKGIKQSQLTINTKPFHFHEILLKPNILIKFQKVVINVDEFIQKNEFDLFIELILKELNEPDLFSVKASSRKPLCSFVIAYFANNNNLEDVVASGSKYLNTTIDELEVFYKDNFKEFRESKVPKRKDLVEKLVNLRTECLDELYGLITSLSDNIFANSLYKFLQEYTKIINKNSFQNIIAPLISPSLYSRPVIESLLKPITEARDKADIEEKFNHFDSNKNLFISYLTLIDRKNSTHVKIFDKIGVYLYNLFKKECDAVDVKSAIVELSATDRKYNFANRHRTEYDLFIRVQNTGAGLGRDIVITPISDTFQFNAYNIGNLKPAETREISILANVIKAVESPNLSVKCTWVNAGEIRKEEIQKIQFGIQNLDIPWEKLEKEKPYTIQEIDTKEKLYGRDEILKDLEQNILSEKIESYKIWGQKRVGKSSIVKTLKTLFNNKEKIIVVWRSIAGLKNTDPLLTLNTLGESICSEIFEEIDIKIQNPGIKQSLRTIPVPEFNGSLFPLENYIKKLKRIDETLRFVFIIDEFDRINEEFFLPGNLGDSFSLNIGKGINSLSYVGFILVGSENMHLLDRQEINYNSFQNREVDTFNKEREFESFKKIVTGPVHPYISYSNESVEKIYDVTNGNPYFANLICSNIFSICSKLKDNEVDIATVTKAVNLIVESYQKSHFEHFWADGITEDSNVKKERKSDIRRRILVSYSLCYFQKKVFPEKEDVVRNFKKSLEYDTEEYEIDNAITEFYNRKIFFDENGVIRIRPLIFELWLCGPGRTLMIEGISDLEALQREKQLEVEHALKDEELLRISDNLKFKGAKIKVSELSHYFNQFGGPFEQRRIYSLFDKITYISKEEVIEFFKREQKNIFKKTELSIKSNIKSPYREDVEFYSFPETLNENNDLFETFKPLSFLRKNRTLKNIHDNKEAWKTSGSNDIIILETVIDDFTTIQQNLLGLFDDGLIENKIPVKLVVLLITSKAKADLIKIMSAYPNFKLIHYREIEESKIKPFSDTTEVFETTEEARWAFAEVRKHFHETSKESLSVLIETHCPSKSIPIFWLNTRQFVSIFPNQNGTLYKEIKSDDGEKYRDRIYQANKELIQKLNPFLINYIKDKAKANNKEDWFIIDYVPKAVMDKIFQKWIEEGTSKPKETYFDLIHYKEIIKKHTELIPLFQMKEGGGDGLNWIDKVNELRRDPAHPEKPPPSLEQALYFESKKNEVLQRISSFQSKNSLN